jgi:hypothetical protein
MNFHHSTASSIRKNYPYPQAKYENLHQWDLPKLLVTEDKLNLEVMPVCSGLN